MYAKANTDDVVAGTHIAEARGRQHLGCIIGHVLAHTKLVLLQTRIECEQRQTKFVLGFSCPLKKLSEIPQNFAEATQRYMPRTRLYGLLLEFNSGGILADKERTLQRIRATLVAKTAQVV